ncbi:MAG: competence/damage-inducible protein A [Candidatus Bathyarchaeia archaeon]
MKFRDACKAELIITGDEILFGRILDTNSNWIAKRLVELGATLRRVTVVGDDLTDIGLSLKEALRRENDVIIFTGGLGPSSDDLTVQALSRTLNREIELDPDTVEKINEVYRRRGIEDSDRGLRMARILEGADPIRNPVGFSVGMRLVERGRWIFTLPGIPEEMKSMFDHSIAPVIEDYGAGRLVARTVVVRMVWKDFFPLYREMQDDFKQIYIKNAATPPQEEERHKVHGIKVDIVVRGETREEADQVMDEFLEEYQRRIELAGGGEIVPC